jgi:K+-sensing histidine kinase KdpD
MGGTIRPILLRYGGAVLAAALAVLVRWVLDPWLGDLLPLAVLFGAVAFAVWYGGSWPAVVAAAVGYLACDWLFMPPRGAFGFIDFPHVLALATYVLSCAIIIIFAKAVHGARQDA